MALVRGTTGASVKLGERIAQGGQGEIFKVVGDVRLVAKRIFDHLLAGDAFADRLAVMVALRPSAWQELKSGHVMLSWPIDTLVDSGRFVGFLMPFVDLSVAVELHEIANPSSRSERGSPHAWTSGFTWRYLAATAANLAMATSTLHKGGVVIGDFNERNILVHQDARVTLIDCDSMQVADPGTGRRFLCAVGRPEFTAPEILGADWKVTVRNPSSDLFALAVHLHQLILEGSHPFDGVWHGLGEKPPRPKLARDGRWVYAGDPQLAPRPGAVTIDLLPASTKAMFRRAFVDGARNPRDRPDAHEWHQELASFATKMRPCAKDATHAYLDHLADCPWCARSSASHAQTALPPARAARRPATAFPAPAATTLAPAAVVTTAPAAKSRVMRNRYALRTALRETLWFHLLVPVIASLVGAIWAATTFATSADSQPYLSGLTFLAEVSTITGGAALALSVSFDVLVWRRGGNRFAILRRPKWQVPLLMASAIIPPVFYAVVHRGQSFSSLGPGRFGPPQVFWWLAPSAMVLTHAISLAARWSTES